MYEINEPAKWVGAVAPHLERLFRVFRFAAPLSDPVGGTTRNKGRHPVKMLEPVPAADAPEHTIERIMGNLQLMDSCLRLYGNHESYYRYNGSLTTPPCTEGIQWYVLKKPGHIAAEQAATFVKLIGEDARGPQPLNARIVLEK